MGEKPVKFKSEPVCQAGVAEVQGTAGQRRRDGQAERRRSVSVNTWLASPCPLYPYFFSADLNPDAGVNCRSERRRLFDDRGNPLNVNEARIEFGYDDSDPDVIRVTVAPFLNLALY